MSKTTQTAKTMSLIINGIKGSINNFSLEELTSLLKQNKCPYWNRVATILLSHNLLVKDGKNKYNFVNSCPIYYIHFVTGINQIIDRQNKYNNKWKNKTKVIEVNPFEGLEKYSINTITAYLSKNLNKY